MCAAFKREALHGRWVGRSWAEWVQNGVLCLPKEDRVPQNSTRDQIKAEAGAQTRRTDCGLRILVARVAPQLLDHRSEDNGPLQNDDG